MTWLGAEATRAALPYPELLAALRTAVLELDAGRIVCPERLVVPLPDGGAMLSMPAVADDIASHKLITVTPRNAALGLPTIRGQVTVLDPRTGHTALVLDGPTVTGRRTAAMSMLGLATLWPAPHPEPRHFLVIGTGTQAAHHVEAIAALQPGARLSIRGSSQAATERFCREQRAVHAAMAPDDGAATVDVVITCTTSRVAVYDAPASADRLLIAVGAFQATAAEIGASTVLASRVFVDDPSGARHEAGDLILAGVDWSRVHPLAQALKQGPPGGAEALLFKSVGCAAWDLAAARVALQRHLAGLP